MLYSKVVRVISLFVYNLSASQKTVACIGWQMLRIMPKVAPEISDLLSLTSTTAFGYMYSYTLTYRQSSHTATTMMLTNLHASTSRAVMAGARSIHASARAMAKAPLRPTRTSTYTDTLGVRPADTRS